MALIELRHLHKVYGSVQALQDLNLEVPEACLYGLLGPNGAGKTTTLRILATLLAPDSGEVRVDGIDALQDPRAVRQRLGYVARRWRSTRSSPAENCWCCGICITFNGVSGWAIAELIDRLGMADWADRR